MQLQIAEKQIGQDDNAIPLSPEELVPDIALRALANSDHHQFSVNSGPVEIVTKDRLPGIALTNPLTVVSSPQAFDRMSFSDGGLRVGLSSQNLRGHGVKIFEQSVCEFTRGLNFFGSFEICVLVVGGKVATFEDNGNPVGHRLWKITNLDQFLKFNAQSRVFRQGNYSISNSVSKQWCDRSVHCFAITCCGGRKQFCDQSSFGFKQRFSDIVRQICWYFFTGDDRKSANKLAGIRLSTNVVYKTFEFLNINLVSIRSSGRVVAIYCNKIQQNKAGATFTPSHSLIESSTWFRTGELSVDRFNTEHRTSNIFRKTEGAIKLDKCNHNNTSASYISEIQRLCQRPGGIPERTASSIQICRRKRKNSLVRRSCNRIVGLHLYSGAGKKLAPLDFLEAA